MVEVIGTAEFEAWYMSLDKATETAVVRVVGLLEAHGVTLGHPYSSAIIGWRYPIRELRIQAAGHPVRVFYAFDPLRQAVLLLGADKSGEGNALYARVQARVERIWEEYLKRI